MQSVTGSTVGALSGLKLLAGLGAIGLIAGGALGFTVLKSDDDDSSGVGAVVETQQYSLYLCPGGALDGIAYPGDRVYVTGRDESGGWLEIRDPRNQGNVRWIPAGAADPDTVVDVPVHDCNEPIELIAETATTTTVVEPTTTTPVTTPVTAAPDTQKPVVSNGTRNPDTIYDTDSAPGCTAFQSTITVQASDNVAVSQVTGTYGAGLLGSPLAFVHGAGNTWTATFGPFAAIATDNYDQNVGISIVARDAAGNTSTAIVVTVHVLGYCLI